MNIVPVESKNDIKAVRSLFREYEKILNADLSFQGFEDEWTGLPGKYAPPDGVLLLARIKGEAVGCVALRKPAPGVAEMKRLYVKPSYLRQGIGRRLALSVIEKAGQAGYDLIRLDTLDRLKAAMALYADLGFRKRPPYYANPLPGTVYWELNLNRSE